jgi:hypothetical protein
VRVRPDAHGVVKRRLKNLFIASGPAHRFTADEGDAVLARSSGTTTSTFIFGRRFIVDVQPR